MTDADTDTVQILPTVRTSTRYWFVLVTIAMLVTMPAVASAGTAQSTTAGDLPAEPAFVVALDDDGSARVTLVVTFDLATADDRAAFDAFRENATAREHRADQFATQMRAIATNAENETGREMQVRDPAVAFAERNDTGIVALSVTWDGLAVRKGDQLVLREPFAGGFDVDRTFRVVGPDGYDLATATPAPDDRTQQSATWGTEQRFDGFEASFAPAQDGSPGFGTGVGALALLVSATTALYRRQNRQ